MATNLNTLATHTSGLYETDFVAWAEQQATLLERGQFDQLDVRNLVDEVLDLSRRERQALFSNLKVVLLYLLKWNYQPAMRSNSWRASVREHRQRIEEQLQNSPSLKLILEQRFVECYQKARPLAADETGLEMSVFPPECPFTLAEVLDAEFLSQDGADS